MNTNNAAIRQDLIENSVDQQVSTLTSSAASPGQLETLLNSELDHDLIEWPRQYLETYLDSDATGRVPLNPEQLQDVLEAAFDRDGTAARNYLEALNGERGPTNLGDSTLQIVTRRGEGKDQGYELLFDPTDSQDLKHLIEQLDIRAWEKQNAQPTPTLLPTEGVRPAPCKMRRTTPSRRSSWDARGGRPCRSCRACSSARRLRCAGGAVHRAKIS